LDDLISKWICYRQATKGDGGIIFLLIWACSIFLIRIGWKSLLQCLHALDSVLAQGEARDILHLPHLLLLSLAIKFLSFDRVGEVILELFFVNGVGFIPLHFLHLLASSRLLGFLGHMLGPIHARLRIDADAVFTVSSVAVADINTAFMLKLN